MEQIMTHQQIIDRDIVEQYARNRLSLDDRRAFQEHFFECDECFAQAQATARFIADLRQAAATGALATDQPRKADSFWGSGWLRPVLAFSLATVFVLAVALVWLYVGRVRLQRQIAAEQQARQTSAAGQQEASEKAKLAAEDKQRQLEVEQAERAKLPSRQNEMEGNKARPRPDQNLIARANVPSVTLESTRDSSMVAQLAIGAGTQKVLLLIPVEVNNRFENFAVDILTKSKAPVTTVSRLSPNRSGTLSVSVPAAHLETSDYRVRLFGKTATGRELLAEYDLRVIKK